MFHISHVRTQQCLSLWLLPLLLSGTLDKQKKKGNDVNGAALVRAESYIITLLAACLHRYSIKRYM